MCILNFFPSTKLIHWGLTYLILKAYIMFLKLVYIFNGFHNGFIRVKELEVKLLT
jgi:hypothetical protein